MVLLHINYWPNGYLPLQGGGYAPDFLVPGLFQSLWAAIDGEHRTLDTNGNVL